MSNIYTSCSVYYTLALHDESPTVQTVPCSMLRSTGEHMFASTLISPDNFGQTPNESQKST